MVRLPPKISRILPGSLEGVLSFQGHTRGEYGPARASDLLGGMLMDAILAVLMFAVLLGSLWDIRRGQRITEALVRDVHASAERIEQSAVRIGQLTAEV